MASARTVATLRAMAVDEHDFMDMCAQWEDKKSNIRTRVRKFREGELGAAPGYGGLVALQAKAEREVAREKAKLARMYEEGRTGCERPGFGAQHLVDPSLLPAAPKPFGIPAGPVPKKARTAPPPKPAAAPVKPVNRMAVFAAAARAAATPRPPPAPVVVAPPPAPVVVAPPADLLTALDAMGRPDPGELAPPAGGEAAWDALFGSD